MYKPYDHVNSHSNLFHLATRHMIYHYSFTCEWDYLEINWTQPRFLPEWYQVTHKYTCTVNAASVFNYEMESYVITNQHYLSSGTTSFRLSNLCVRSAWTLILKAVYNPASIDSGIMITGPTFTKTTSKRNSALGDFLILVGYFYVYNSICGQSQSKN